jgi:pyridoxine 4-dehydrogenase
MKEQTENPAGLAGTLSLGGELEVRRLGFGAMRITGDGIWGPPKRVFEKFTSVLKER